MPDLTRSTTASSRKRKAAEISSKTPSKRPALAPEVSNRPIGVTRLGLERMQLVVINIIEGVEAMHRRLITFNNKIAGVL